MSELSRRNKEEQKGPVVAAIGSGGKTAVLTCLARQASKRGLSVFFTTTTHIFPLLPPDSRKLLSDPSESELLDALDAPGIVCAGRKDGQKLKALKENLFKIASEKADLTLCEADGSRRLPLKLHREGEPVIPDGTDVCVITAGLSALGRPVSQCIHRYDQNPEWKAEPDRIITANELVYCIEDAVTAALSQEPSSRPSFRLKVLLNQKDVLRLPARNPESPFSRSFSSLPQSPDSEAKKAVSCLTKLGLDCRTESLLSDSSFLWDWIFR